MLLLLVYAANIKVVCGNNEFLFTGDMLGSVFAWTTSFFGKDPRLLKDGTNTAHTDAINAIVATKSYLFTAGNDKRSKQWHLKTFTRVASFALGWIPYSIFAHNDVLLVGGIEVLAYFNLVNYEQDIATSAVTSKPKTETSVAPVIGSNEGANELAFPLWQVTVAVTCLLLTLSVLTLWLRKRFSLKTTSPKETSPVETSVITSWTGLSTQLQTIVPLSVHAEFKQEPANFVPVKKIAEGGGGKVFLCQLMSTPLKVKYGEVVVQKLVQIKSKISEDAFNQEVAINIMLGTYPFFVDIVGFTINPYSIILRYYEDGSLYEWIKKSQGRGKTSPSLKVISEIASAISTMHGHFIAHCDLKPHNILIQLKDDGPTCFITDFGIAQVLSDKVVATKMFTIVSLRGLSVFYASPEAFQNFRKKDYRKVDYKKCDMYSFASIMYEVVTRKIQWS
jgi:serine/threonine protein kinase